MATAKSDDDSEQRQHPLANDRPGVYVHVVGAPRRRVARAESGEVVIESKLGRTSAPLDAPSSEPITVPGETVASEVEAREPEQVRQSGISFERSDAGVATEVASENTNHRADLMVVNLPGPPRVPNMALGAAPLPEALGESRSASLLDAPHSMRPETLVPRSGPSWLLLSCVAMLSAIIAAAIVVAVRQPARPTAAPAVHVETGVTAQEQVQSGFARYIAEDAARQAARHKAAQEAAAAEARLAQPAPGPTLVLPVTAQPAQENTRTRKPAQPAPASKAQAAAGAAARPTHSTSPAASRPTGPAADTTAASPGSAPAAEPAPSAPVQVEAREPTNEAKELDDTLPANPYEQ